MDDQGTIIANFLTLFAVIILLETGLYKMMLSAIIESYKHIHNLNTDIQITDIIQLLSISYISGFKIAAPITIVSIILYVSAGIINRVLPTIHVFFLITPLQILVGIYMLYLTLQNIALYFYTEYYQTLHNIIGIN